MTHTFPQTALLLPRRRPPEQRGSSHRTSVAVGPPPDRVNTRDHARHGPDLGDKLQLLRACVTEYGEGGGGREPDG